jgi:hypothetical protein
MAEGEETRTDRSHLAVKDTSYYAQRMYNVVRTMPEEMYLYKAIAPFADRLLEYLASQT